MEPNKAFQRKKGHNKIRLWAIKCEHCGGITTIKRIGNQVWWEVASATTCSTCGHSNWKLVVGIV